MYEIGHNRLEYYDTKKLRGHKNLYRAKVGRYRILFKKRIGRNEIVGLKLRDDHTYDI